MSFLDPIFNPWLLPLLDKSPFLGILLLSFVLTLLLTLAYKYLTNQAEMKRLKEEQKEYQKKFKELKDKPEEMMRLQKEAMSKNMEYMKHSLKATLITLLPIILVLGWMTAHLSYEPIYPGEPYSVTAIFTEGTMGMATLVVDGGTTIKGKAQQEVVPSISLKGKGELIWNLQSEEGEHFVTVKTDAAEQTKKVSITKSLNSFEAMATYAHSPIEQIRVNYQKLRPLGPEFTVPLFNWQPGWLGLYVIFSLVFSIGLRKVLNVY